MASAGGLNAFKKFLEAMPKDSGVAVILIAHWIPYYKSMMVPLLSRQTKLPVCEAAGLEWLSSRTASTLRNLIKSLVEYPQAASCLGPAPQTAHMEVTIDFIPAITCALD